MKAERFDPRARANEKQESREADEHDLASGRVTVEELQRRNAFIPGGIARSAVIRSFPIFDDDKEDVT